MTTLVSPRVLFSQRHGSSEAAAAEALRALHVQLDQQAAAVVSIRESAQRVIQDMVRSHFVVREESTSLPHGAVHVTSRLRCVVAVWSRVKPGRAAQCCGGPDQC